MKFKDLVICADMDGTFLNEENKIPKENIEAIEYFRAHGGKFMIATGRMPIAVYPALEGFMPDFPCICHNGCSVYDLKQNRYIEMITLDDGVIPIVKEIASLSDKIGMEVINIDGLCVIKRTDMTDFHAEYEKVTPSFAERIEDVKKPWFKIMFAQHPEETELIKNTFLNSSYKESYSLVKSHSFYFEVYNKNASKGTALKKMCEDYNIDLKNVFAVGDNENDVSMLSVAGTAVAVGNASDVAKAAASIVTCTNEEGAIADLISKI